MSALVLKPALHDRIEEGQKENMYLCRLKRMIDARKRPNFYVTDDGIIRYKGRLCVPFAIGKRLVFSLMIS